MGTKTALKIDSFAFFDNSSFMITEQCKAHNTALALPSVPRECNLKILELPASVLIHLLATCTDQGFWKDEVPQFRPCVFSFGRCHSHLQGYLMRARGQIL